MCAPWLSDSACMSATSWWMRATVAGQTRIIRPMAAPGVLAISSWSFQDA